jgi:hypothetical protein
VLTTHSIGGDALLLELGELALEGIRILLSERLHVVSNVLAKDAVTVGIGAVFLAGLVVTRKALGAEHINIKYSIIHIIAVFTQKSLFAAFLY